MCGRGTTLAIIYKDSLWAFSLVSPRHLMSSPVIPPAHFDPRVTDDPWPHIAEQTVTIQYASATHSSFIADYSRQSQGFVSCGNLFGDKCLQPGGENKFRIFRVRIPCFKATSLSLLTSSVSNCQNRALTDGHQVTTPSESVEPTSKSSYRWHPYERFRPPDASRVKNFLDRRARRAQRSRSGSGSRERSLPLTPREISRISSTPTPAADSSAESPTGASPGKVHPAVRRRYGKQHSRLDSVQDEVPPPLRLPDISKISPPDPAPDSSADSPPGSSSSTLSAAYMDRFVCERCPNKPDCATYFTLMLHLWLKHGVLANLATIDSDRRAVE